MEIILQVVGGLGLFLLGMKNMSEGMQTIAGNRLRRLIGLVTNNRLMATGVGLFATTLVQSSSVTTVMTVGFVNAGLMTLKQAIGVILGANIGTTITGWILVLKIGKHGLPMLGIAAFFYLFSKKESWRYVAMAIMGLGMVFFGLELMKNGFKPLRGMAGFSAMFSYFDATTGILGVWKCAAVGCILTMIVQSSSATLGITIGLASTGVIEFPTAAALVLGENVGTTITALLASIGTNTNAKRTAYAHALFNVLGVLWITLLFTPYLHIVLKILGENPTLAVIEAGETTYPHATAGIAMVHSGFNIANTLLFLPLVSVMAAFLTRFVPERAEKEAPHLTHLDVHMLETPAISIEQSRVEIMRMGMHVITMMDYLKTILSDEEEGDRLIKKVFHREEVLDVMQNEVVVFLTHLMSTNVPLSTADEARRQLRMADEYESVGDYVANLLKGQLRLVNKGFRLPEKNRDELLQLHDTVCSYVKMINTAYDNQNFDILSKAQTEGNGITHQVRTFRDQHLAGLTEIQIEPVASTVYTDMLNAYRRIKDHMLNVAEALAGAK
ncbi:Na/Pi cotransporter family protein [Candidatus Hydrogenedentota bacterium]